MTISGAVYREGVAYSPDGAMYVTPTGSASITGGSISGVSGVRVKLASWGVPIIIASSGSIGNNGALTGHTSLPRTYSGGAYVYYPANAIAAGVVAGFYWTVFSSATAGTIFNNTYSGSGVPSVPTSNTAFVTTGPGAYTGVTTEQGIVIDIAAGLLGTNGNLEVVIEGANNNSAGTKTYRARLGGAAGTAFISSAQTTGTGPFVFGTKVWNAGVANSQQGYSTFMQSGGGGLLASQTTAAVDTTAATDVRITGTHGGATDFVLIESGEVLYVQ